MIKVTTSNKLTINSLEYDTKARNTHLLQLFTCHVAHLQLGPVLVQQRCVRVLRLVPAASTEVRPAVHKNDLVVNFLINKYLSIVIFHKSLTIMPIYFPRVWRCWTSLLFYWSPTCLGHVLFALWSLCFRHWESALLVKFVCAYLLESDFKCLSMFIHTEQLKSIRQHVQCVQRHNQTMKIRSSCQSQLIIITSHQKQCRTAELLVNTYCRFRRQWYSYLLVAKNWNPGATSMQSSRPGIISFLFSINGSSTDIWKGDILV